MPYTAQTALRGSPRGSADAISAWAIARGAARPDDVRAYLAWLYTLAPQVGINPDVAVAQWLVECSDRATGQVPGQSVPWVYGLNPAGIGVTDDSQWRVYDFKIGAQAAAVHLAHLGLYAGADVPPEMIVQDPRWTAAMRAGYRGIAPTLDGLTNTWAKDARYASKIADQLNRLEAAGLLPANVEAPPMAYKAHTWPGLKNPVYLPDDIPVEVKIITHTRFRSFIKSSAHTRTTWHDTGNPNTNADAEYRWANGGREGAGVGGYNGIFDDRKIIITQPFDEVVWAAGTPEGNRTSFHFEQAWGGSVNFARSVEIGEALHGGLCAAMGWQVDTALVQHHYWYGKNCPGQIRRRGTWSTVVKGVSEAAASARAAAGGGGTGGAPAPTYAKPAPIKALDDISKGDSIAPATVHDPSSGVDFIWTGDRYRVVKETPRSRYATADGDVVGPPLKPGEEFDGDWVFFTGGEWWLMTPYATRVRLVDLERISDTKGAQGEEAA